MLTPPEAEWTRRSCEICIPVEGDDNSESVLVIPNNVKELFGEESCCAEKINTTVKRIEFEPGGSIEVQEGAFSFYYPNIEEVLFTDSVKSIGDYTFPEKMFKEIILHDGLTCVGREAFTGCKNVERIVIPDSVTMIGNGAFNGCNLLKVIECSKENLDRFFDSFSAKNKFKMILGYLEGSYKCTVPFGEKTIAYVQRNQKKIIDTILEKDNDLALGALLALPIQEDTKYLKEIEKKAGTKVQGVLLDFLHKNEDPEMAENLMLEDSPSKPKSSAEWKQTFKLTNVGEKEICIGSYKEYETSVSIPEMIGKRKVTKLDKTFFRNSSVTNIYLPECLKEIGEHTFDGCNSLQQIIIPEKVKKIGFCAFRGCSSLTEISIPNGVSSIDSNAFANCINITSIIIPDTVRRIGEKTGGYLFGSIFEGCSNLENIELSAKLNYIPDSTFRGCKNLRKIVLPDGLKELGGFAFSGCENLQTIYIPSSVSIISVDHVFSGCVNLTIHAPSGSYAEQYAKEHNIPFVAEN